MCTMARITNMPVGPMVDMAPPEITGPVTDPNPLTKTIVLLAATICSGCS